MKLTAIINNKYCDVELIDANYDPGYKIEVKITSGIWTGQYAIIGIDNLILERQPRMSDIYFKKCEDCFMGEYRKFWRADFDRVTISTMCRTKKECMEEVRTYLNTHDLLIRDWGRTALRNYNRGKQT